MSLVQAENPSLRQGRDHRTALGLLAGLYLSYVMVLGMRGIFPKAYSFPLGGLVAAVAVGLIFGVIAALIPTRQAAGMEIVRALRYE
jgi:putative ABC transport system permease protein